MRKLDILFVSEYFYPRAAGGEVWAWELCTALAKRGHKVTVITCSHTKLPADETVSGVRILRPVATVQKVGSRLLRSFFARRLTSKVEEYLSKHKPDVIHVMAYAINVQVSRLAKKLRIPCVTSVHSYFGESWSAISSLPQLLQVLERRAITQDQSSVLHVPSRFVHHRIKEDTGKESVVIHNWVAGSFPKPKKLEPRSLVFMGSLEPVKNPVACVATAKSLQAKLYVIGRGSMRSDMVEESIRKDQPITFLEQLPRSEALSYLGGADMVLVPSISESFSLVALEALAQGTPVSGNPVGILPELDGVIPFPPKKIPPRRMSQQMALVRKQFAKDAILPEFERLYASILP
jgi:glycogen synthase